MTRLWAASFGVLLLAAPMRAHHSYSATYDGERQITLEGVVTRIEWVNPHAYLFVDDADSTGTTTNWAVEFGNPFDLERAGWTESSLKVGERVTIRGVPARDQSKRAFGASVVRVSNKERLFVAPTNKPAPQAKKQPIPRWPDGQVRLGAAPGEKGFWGKASAVGLVETKNGEIRMNADALLFDLADVDRVAPFRPWAKAVYEYRQRNLLVDDPLSRCLPPGGARQFQGAYGFQFLEQRELKRILLLLGGGNRNWHPIYMDGRKLTPDQIATPTYYGTSAGRWEKDTLVVETTGFNERFWFANGGLPHTSALRLIQRFTRSDYNTLRYEVTVEDPRTYTRSWTGGWTIEWVPDREIQEYFCEENAETTFIRRLEEEEQ
jgi:hypothetical protein